MDILKVQASSVANAEALIAMQLRLMERAFYVLRLDHFANAPENHGWMNLFRTWSCQKEFVTHYHVLRRTLTPGFRSFFEAYIDGYAETMDTRPIHHPWQRTAGDRGVGLFMDTGRTEPMAVPPSTRPGADGITDAKGRAGVDQTFEKSSGGTSSDGGSSIPNA
jgi:hypothetical protein